MTRAPWVTLAIAGAALVVAGVPGLGDHLALELGDPWQPWRWWASHLGHFSWNHLGWDVLVLLVLGAALEREDRRGAALLYALAPPVVALGAAALAPSVGTYRGLSGLDSALAGAVIVSTWRSARDARGRWTAGLLAAAALAKISFELATGDTVFARAEGWVPVPVAHGIGGLVGACLWAWAVGPRIEVSHDGPLPSSRVAVARPGLRSAGV